MVLTWSFILPLYMPICAKLFSSRRNWDSPNPSPAGACAPPLWFRGEGHTRWRERGWESPNSNEGPYTVVLFVYTYFVGCRNERPGADQVDRVWQVRQPAGPRPGRFGQRLRGHAPLFYRKVSLRFLNKFNIFLNFLQRWNS